MYKVILSAILIFSITGCDFGWKRSKIKIEPSAQEKVNGLQTMCANASEAMKARQAEKTLYSRLGGEEGIRTFTTKLLASHQANPTIGHRFKHLPKDRFVNNVTHFLSTHSGGGGEYKGRTMKEVHLGMDITSEEFLVAGGEVKAVMKELGAGENEIQEAVCFLVSFVPDVVVD